MGLGGIAPSASGQARSAHRGVAAPGEEGVDGNSRHRELSPAKGDSSHGEGPTDFRSQPRGPCLRLEDVAVLLPRDIAAQRAKNAVAKFPDNPEDLWKIEMRPEAGYLSVVSSSFNALPICTSPFPTP